MISIGEAFFHLDGANFNDEAIKNFARQLFKEFDANCSSLPLSDYSLELIVEEGSLKGKGKIMATLAVLYIGIGEFGDFIQGVREMSQMTKHIGEELIGKAESKVATKASLKWKRADAGTLGKVERIFQQVKEGNLEPREAAELTVQLLSEEDELPDRMLEEINESMKRIKKNPKQFDLYPFSDDVSYELGPSHQERPRSPRPQRSREAAPVNKLRVELRKDKRNGKTILRIVNL